MKITSSEAEKTNSGIPASIFIIGSILLAYLLLYLPISKQLNIVLIDKWRISAQAKVYSLNLAVQQQIEGGESISSRSAIREKIVEYIQDEISWQELQEFTETKYYDGVSVLDNLVFAYRKVDNRVLVEYFPAGQALNSNQLFSSVEKLQSNQILKFDGNIYLLIKSEIKLDNILLGYDFVCYDLSKVIADLNSEGETLQIVSASELPEEDHAEQKNILFPQKSEIVTFTEKLSGVDAILKIQTTYDYILGSTRRITNTYLFLYILVIILLYILSSIILLRKTKHVIQKIESRKRDYEKLAYQDALTGAYSRQFLASWVEKSVKGFGTEMDQYVIVLLDVDFFKSINDNYGHEAGDLVLKTIVIAIKKILRKEDLVIRYGGDEFLIIFKKIEESIVFAIMQRIETELKKMELLPVEIGISYGISSIKEINLLDHGIKQADQKMYMEKRKKTTP